MKKFHHVIDLFKTSLYLCENVLLIKLSPARSHRIYLVKATPPEYWLTYLFKGDPERLWCSGIADCTFATELRCQIVETSYYMSFPPLRGRCTQILIFFKIVYFTNTTMRNSFFSHFCSTILQNGVRAYKVSKISTNILLTK